MSRIPKSKIKEFESLELVPIGALRVFKLRGGNRALWLTQDEFIRDLKNQYRERVFKNGWINHCL